MVECRNCRAVFETPPEKIGSRCPDCKVPLFERLERPKREVESGACSVHADLPGVGICKRCKARFCGVCRTRWHEDNLCLECVEKSLAAGEEHPRELKNRRRLAVLGSTCAFIGAALWLTAMLVFYSTRLSPSATAAAWSVALMLIGLVPATIAIGLTTTVVLARGPLFRLASSGIAVAATQIGLTLGLLVVNLLRN